MVERKVFICFEERKCADCNTLIEVNDFIVREFEGYMTCLKCAGLERLVFLPTGDACVTRRAKQYSSTWEEVVWFNRRHKRNERRGILVEKEALEKAQKSCLEDQAEREQKQQIAAQKRAEQDCQHLMDFTAAIRAHYPSCPDEDVQEIAEYACEKYSRRVGRSQMAKNLDSNAVDLAVRAYIRHCYTDYDYFCALYSDRKFARECFQQHLDLIAAAWTKKPDPKKGKKRFPRIYDVDYESHWLKERGEL